MSELRDRGVVLRTYKLGESDRICVLLTERYGKVRAVARGVRKTTSRLGSRMEPLDVVDVLFGISRSELWGVRQVSGAGGSPAIRADYDRLSAAMVIADATDVMTPEHLSDPELFEMLTRALGALEQAASPQATSTAYLLKLLAHDGAMPVLDRCARCGEQDDLVAFDAAEGGLLCRNCRSGRAISADAVALLRRMLLGGLAGVLQESDPVGLEEATSIAVEAIEVHAGRRLKAARTLGSA